MTTTLMVSTEAQLNEDIVTANAATSGSFVIDLDGNITLTANLDAINLQSGVTLTIDGEGYALDDAGGYNGFVVAPVEPFPVLTIENLDIINTVPPPPPSSAFSGTETIGTTQTVDQTADVLLGGTNGAGSIINQGTYEIDQLTAGATGGPFGEAYGPAIYDGGVAGDLFTNEGTLVKLDNADDHSGVSEIFVDVTDTGTISVQDGGSNLRFDGANNSFSGTYIGGGMIDYGDPLTPGYGTDDLGTLDMTADACTTSWATVNQSGEITVSDHTTISNGTDINNTVIAGTWNFTSNNGIALSDLPTNSTSTFYNYGTLAKTGGTGTTVIACDFSGGPGGLINVETGTLAFDGLSNTFNNFLETNAIYGAGTFSLGGGGADAIYAGTITTAAWTITDAGTDVTLYESLSYAGTFTVQSGASLTLSSQYTHVALTAANLMVTNGGAIDILDGGTLAGNVINDGTVNYDITGGATFSGTLTGSGTLVVSGGGHLDVVSASTGVAQIDDASTLEFTGPYVGAATFSGSSTGSGGTLKFDAGSTGPITVVNSNDTVIAQPGNGSWIDAAVSYTLPTNIDTLFLFAGAQGTGNSDASGDALYALDTVNTQTLTGNSANDAFVVYNSSDVVVPKAGSHDTVYTAASYTLPTGVDALFLEGTAAQGTGNSDAAGDALYAASPGQVATLIGNSANDVYVVYNSSDVVVPKAGSHDFVYSAVNYALPSGVDVLFLEAGTHGVGNSDAAGDALYAADAGITQTLTGNSANDAFVVYNSADVVTPKAGSHDTVYAAVNYTLPTGVDTLFLEAGTQGVGNNDASGDVLYAADAGIAQTLTGHSHNDSFVVYNSADSVIGQAGSSDTVYAAASFTLPTNVDTLLLEGNASHGAGNGDAVDALYGNFNAASTLVAGGGADTLHVTGTAGTIMTGSAGHDTFAFPNATGHDEVTNFGVGKDTLQFNATLFANFTAAMNTASQVGANTVFTIDANDTVTLDNVSKSSLTASNFHFA